MALTATTLAAAIDATQRLITLTSGTSVAVGVLARVDSELLRVQTAGPAATQWYVERGINGSAAVAHAILAPFIHGLPSDFAADPHRIANVKAYGAAGAVTVPAVDTTVLFCSGAASAMTIADPSLADEGRRVRFIANSAHAYTLTNTTGFGAGGASLDVATWGGAVGDAMDVEARGGKWFVTNLLNVTLG